MIRIRYKSIYNLFYSQNKKLKYPFNILTLTGFIDFLRGFFEESEEELLEDIKEAEKLKNDRLIAYIKKERANGFSDEEIKKQLIKYNHSPESISAAFSGLGVKQVIPKKKVYLMLVLCLIILAAGFIAFDPIKKINGWLEKQEVETAEPVQEAPTPKPPTIDYKGRVRSFVEGSDLGFWRCMSHAYEDASYCDGLEDVPGPGTVMAPKPECIQRFNLFMAVEKDDISYCNYIPDDNVKVGCRAAVQNDLSLCSGAVSQVAAMCEELIRLLNGEILPTKDRSGGVLELYYIAKAIQTKDIDYCDKIVKEDNESTDVVRNECRAVVSKDASHCGDILTMSIDKSCDLVVPDSLKTTCLSDWKEELKGEWLAK